MSTSEENNQPAVLLFPDEASFERIFRDNYAVLCRIALRVLKDEEEKAEDVVQELFARLWETRETRTISVAPKAYLARAAHNAALDYLEKHKKQVNPTDEQWQQLQPAANITDEIISHSETETQIAHALQKLPPACKEVFLLSREDELSYKEIADTLQISVKTVESQMGKALKILRQELLPYLGQILKVLVLISTFTKNILN